MKPKTHQAQATPYGRLLSHVIRSRGQSLQTLLDFIAPDIPATIQNIRFRNKSISMTVRLPFLLPPADDPGEYLGTLKAQKQFQVGFRKHLSGPECAKHLSNALYKELLAFAFVFTGGHRWGKKVIDKLNTVGERRMAGRPGSIHIEKQEADQIQKQAQIILLTVFEINRRVKKWKSRGPDLRKKIWKCYDSNEYPWIKSLFPALEDLHGKPLLGNLHPREIRKLVSLIIQRERQRETGEFHSLEAIDQLFPRS